MTKNIHTQARDQIQTLWRHRWLLFMIQHGECDWMSSKFLYDYDDWLKDTYSQARSQGYTARQWLRAIRTLPEKSIWEGEHISFLYIPK